MWNPVRWEKIGKKIVVWKMVVWKVGERKNVE